MYNQIHLQNLEVSEHLTQKILKKALICGTQNITLLLAIH